MREAKKSVKNFNRMYQAHEDVLRDVPLDMQNKLMSEHVRFGFDVNRHQRNLNTLVLGGAGSWKTMRFFIPNLLQMNTSFIVTDPKGELASKLGDGLKKNGYRVAVFDVANPWKSACYNPFRYFRPDKYQNMSPRAAKKTLGEINQNFRLLDNNINAALSNIMQREMQIQRSDELERS